MKTLMALWLTFGISTTLVAGGYCWKIKNLDEKNLCEALME